MKRIVMGLVLCLCAWMSGCTEPKAIAALEGTWEGSAVPAGGTSVQVQLILTPQSNTYATGSGSFTSATGALSYGSISAVLSNLTDVSITMASSTGAPAAFFQGQLTGGTMTGKVSGGSFPSDGTQITLTRK